jgi:hypothetical protein
LSPCAVTPWRRLPSNRASATRSPYAFLPWCFVRTRHPLYVRPLISPYQAAPGSSALTSLLMAASKLEAVPMEGVPVPSAATPIRVPSKPASSSPSPRYDITAALFLSFFLLLAYCRQSSASAIPFVPGGAHSRYRRLLGSAAGLVTAADDAIPMLKRARISDLDDFTTYRAPGEVQAYGCFWCPHGFVSRLVR